MSSDAKWMPFWKMLYPSTNYTAAMGLNIWHIMTKLRMGKNSKTCMMQEVRLDDKIYEYFHFQMWKLTHEKDLETCPGLESKSLRPSMF